MKPSDLSMNRMIAAATPYNGCDYQSLSYKQGRRNVEMQKTKPVERGILFSTYLTCTHSTLERVRAHLVFTNPTSEVLVAYPVTDDWYFGYVEDSLVPGSWKNKRKMFLLANVLGEKNTNHGRYLIVFTSFLILSKYMNSNSFSL